MKTWWYYSEDTFKEISCVYFIVLYIYTRIFIIWIIQFLNQFLNLLQGKGSQISF